MAAPWPPRPRNFRVTEPVLLPIFDGGLAIDTLRVRHAGTAEMYVRFDAEVRPISVALLSRAFGWPGFQGTFAGRIPGLQLRQGVVTLDGNLDAEIFDGRVAVRGLSLRDPLGKFPRMHASIGIENLDLALVTQTFEFGMIAGRLSGYVSDLETFGWMPESFDAFLFTPPDDRSGTASASARSRTCLHRRRQRRRRRRGAAGRLPQVLRRFPLRPARAFMPPRE